MGHPDSYMKYNFAAMDQMASDLGASTGKLTTTLEELDQRARPMVATWSGPAQVAYNAHQARWLAAAEGVAESLRRMQGAVAEARTMMMSTNSRAADMFTP